MGENVIPQNMDNLFDQYLELEKLMAKLTNEYREAKKELFGLVESVMKEQKLLEKLYP